MDRQRLEGRDGDMTTLAEVQPQERSAFLDQVEVRQAVAADNEALLALTRLTPMAGRISLRIDREPDFFALPRARGASKFFVAVWEGMIIGCFSVTLHEVYVEGKLERISHGNDLKVHPQFAGRRVGLRLLFAGEQYLRSQGIDISVALFAEGNQRVVTLAEGRHGQAKSLSLGRFFVDQLLPWPFRGRSRQYQIGEATASDLREAGAMLDEANRSRNFAPPATLESVKRWVEERPAGRFRKMLLARTAGRAVATLTVEDTGQLRQNVLMGLPPSLRFALGLLRIATPLIPKIAVPRLGQPLRILYVRFLACVSGHEAALTELLAEARVEAFRHGFTFLSVGLHESDPLRAVVAGIPKLTFTSMLIATSLNTPGRVEALTNQIMYEDFALV
jgi:GNAT superfamily N-acetyltransferase